MQLKSIKPIQICLGLAYAILANCDAISGIYTAFFPVIIYIMLGTSRHVSMGKNYHNIFIYYNINYT